MTELNPKVLKEFANRALISQFVGMEGADFEYHPDGFLSMIRKPWGQEISITEEMRSWSIDFANRYIVDSLGEMKL